MISQRELERRIKSLELISRPRLRVFVYGARDGDIDAERTAIIKRRSRNEFGYDRRNGDIFVELWVMGSNENDEPDPNFRHDFVLKIGNEEYNEGWPFEH